MAYSLKSWPNDVIFAGNIVWWVICGRKTKSGMKVKNSKSIFFSDILSILYKIKNL